MKSAPLVSIITPVFNAEEYLPHLLNSILEQSYPNVEMIAVNDGSTDESMNVMRGYKKRFKKRGYKLLIVEKDNGGVASAVNAGLKFFRGDFITFIDADDYLSHPLSLEKRVGFLDANPNFQAVYSAVNIINKGNRGEIIATMQDRHSPCLDNLFLEMLVGRDYIWNPATYLVRASSFVGVNPRREIVEFDAGQNIQIFLPLWYQSKVGYISEPLVTIVAHDDSHSRMERSAVEKEKRENEIKEIFIDTLNRIDMSVNDRVRYRKMVEDRYAGVSTQVVHLRDQSGDQLTGLYQLDEDRFRHAYVSNIATANKNQLAAKLIFSSHSLEKGLSNDNFETGHGIRTVKTLIDLLDAYNSKGFDITHLAYQNALSVLNEYYKRHEKSVYLKTIEDLIAKYREEILANNMRLAGSSKILKASKRDNSKKNFKELANGRAAIRSYASSPVSMDEVERVVDIAMKTPTVCNRQSLKVRVILDKSVIEKVLKVQGGIDYYDTPPGLLLITADDNGYIGANERNQGYIDGGLFAMSILYAFEYESLAACPLHTMFDEARDGSIRAMLDVSENEKLITFISFGHFKNECQTCRSFRYPSRQIMERVSRANDYVLQYHGYETTQSPKAYTTLRKKIRETIRVRSRLRSARKGARRLLRYMQTRQLSTDRDRGFEGAIITLTGYYNYGNILQRYALQRFLMNNGRKFVSYDHEISPEDERNQAYCYTRGFVDHYIAKAPLDESKKYRWYIVGSDQVWRNWDYQHPIKQLGYFFLDFARGKKIAYAASLGKDTLESAGYDDVLIKRMGELARDFTKISMREDVSAKDASRKLEIDVDTVIDPTMLLSKEAYSKIIDDSPYELDSTGDVFTYILDDSAQTKELVDALCHATNAHSITSMSIKSVDVYEPVEKWLKGFRDGKFVITDSFHGVVFSIINNTDFIVIENGFRGTSRLKNVLQIFGLEDRIVASVDDVKVIGKKKPIEWSVVNDTLHKLRSQDGAWLLDAISK